MHWAKSQVHFGNLEVSGHRRHLHKRIYWECNCDGFSEAREKFKPHIEIEHELVAWRTLGLLPQHDIFYQQANTRGPLSSTLDMPPRPNCDRPEQGVTIKDGFWQWYTDGSSDEPLDDIFKSAGAGGFLLSGSSLEFLNWY